MWYCTDMDVVSYLSYFTYLHVLPKVCNMWMLDSPWVLLPLPLQSPHLPLLCHFPQRQQPHIFLTHCYPAPLQIQFEDSTAYAWNITMNNSPSHGLPSGSSPYMLPGDTVLTSFNPSCLTSGRRSLLASSSIAVGANTNLPNGFTATEASAASTQFSSAATSAYNGSQFASNYGVTGASVSVGNPISNTYYSPSSSNNNLAIGVGVGVGVGVPVLAGAGFAAYYFTKKKGEQVVSPQ
jgi:hypothetical protein